MADEATIRFWVMDFIWEVGGVDRANGIWPENLTCSTNDWGNDKASFDLKRNPGALWPDLAAFTPVEISIAGEVVWTGRISETPAREGDDPVINVQCEGWQYHLDDDVYAKNYVHASLTDWRDVLSHPDVSYASYPTGLRSEVGDGVITLSYPNGSAAAAGSRVGVFLDLGPNNRAKVVSIDWAINATLASSTLYLYGYDSSANMGQDNSSGGHGEGSSANLATTASGTLTATFTTPRRYIAIFFYRSIASAMGADAIVKITRAEVFGDSTYASSGTSVLLASTVVKDARASVLPLLSTDESKISTTAFVIPDLHFEREPKTAREVISGVNAFHNFQSWVDIDKRLVFALRPTTPVFEIGNFGGSVFEDSSMNSGQDVYNRVLVTGTASDGEPIITERTSLLQSTSVLIPVAGISHPNPSADVDALNWTANPGAITRDTTTYDSAPASLALANGAYSLFSGAGTFKAGIPYTVQFRMRRQGGPNPTSIRVVFGHFATAYDVTQTYVSATNIWTTYSLTWIPQVDCPATSATLDINDGGSIALYVDTIKVGQVLGTIVDRRLFNRTKILPIQSALTANVATQIGDTFLSAHKTQPLRGSATVTLGGVREHLTGREVHPASLLRYPAQLLRLNHRIDPDTGAVGRDGTIARVEYNHDARTSTVSLDSERRNFEALLSRLAVIQSSRGV